MGRERDLPDLARGESLRIPYEVKIFPTGSTVPQTVKKWRPL